MAPIWLWIIGAGVLVLLELGLPGTFYFLFLAAAAILAGLSSLVFPWWVQWGVFLASGVVGLILAPKVAGRLTPEHAHVPMNVDSLVGQIGIVEEALDPVHSRGTIKVQGQVWRAVSGEPVAAGERVQVMAVEGTKLIVRHKASWEKLLAEEIEQPRQIEQRRSE